MSVKKKQQEPAKEDIVVVEVGIVLDKNLIYYHDMLIKNGLDLCFFTATHDIYYSKPELDGLTENQMKNACIRLRISEGAKMKPAKK